MKKFYYIIIISNLLLFVLSWSFYFGISDYLSVWHTESLGFVVNFLLILEFLELLFIVFILPWRLIKNKIEKPLMLLFAILSFLCGAFSYFYLCVIA